MRNLGSWSGKGNPKGPKIAKGESTELIDIIPALSQLLHDGNTSNFGFFANRTIAFCENDEFVTRQVVFLDGFADDFFGHAARVDIGGVPLQAVRRSNSTEPLVGILTVLTPRSYAALRIGSDWGF